MNQLIPIPLKSPTWTASGRDTINIDLPPSIMGRIPHLERITFHTHVTPTIANGTTPTARELQALVANCTIRDSVRTLFQGGFRSLRAFGSLESGGVISPEPDSVGTGETVNFMRVWNAAPSPFVLNPSEWAMPAAVFKSGRIDFTWGATTDVHADVSAATVTMDVVAWVSLSDDVRFGPLLERFEMLLSNGTGLSQEALYLFLALGNSQALDAITAADFANVTILCNGLTTEPMHVANLENAYHSAMRVGQVSTIHGEPRAATDDNPKEIRGTAAVATPAILSPIIWFPPNSKISRVVFEAKPSLTVKYSGSQASAYVLATRILPRDTGMSQKYGALIEAGIGVKVQGGDVNTDSKRKYKGPRGAYMGLKLKVG